MRDNSQIHVKLSSELKEQLKEKARTCGLTLAGYVKLVLTKTQISVEKIPE